MGYDQEPVLGTASEPGCRCYHAYMLQLVRCSALMRWQPPYVKPRWFETRRRIARAMSDKIVESGLRHADSISCGPKSLSMSGE